MASTLRVWTLAACLYFLAAVIAHALLPSSPTPARRPAPAFSVLESGAGPLGGAVAAKATHELGAAAWQTRSGKSIAGAHGLPVPFDAAGLRGMAPGDRPAIGDVPVSAARRPSAFRSRAPPLA